MEIGSGLDDAPPIILNIFDTDEGLFGNEDDYMGRSIIYMKDIKDEISYDNKIKMPKWYPIKNDMDDKWDENTGAAILVSFA